MAINDNLRTVGQLKWVMALRLCYLFVSLSVFKSQMIKAVAFYRELDARKWNHFVIVLTKMSISDGCFVLFCQLNCLPYLSYSKQVIWNLWTEARRFVNINKTFFSEKLAVMYNFRFRFRFSSKQWPSP